MKHTKPITRQPFSRIPCPHCRLTFTLDKMQPEQTALFCVFCGKPLEQNPEKQSQDHLSTTSTYSISTSATLVAGQAPENELIQFTIGPYQILRDVGKGGMGEVFLAYDTTCGRRIAIKRIRSDLLKHTQMHNRFLKEARVTSQLTHPAIIPIYAIHNEDNSIYYTMPYVEGETLKQILRTARAQEKQGIKPDQATASIPSLIRIFLSVCQAIGYAHSKGVLHRDVKPENVIVGKYGEVLILDWGLAKLISSPEEEESIEPSNKKEANPLHALTHLGKVVGTVAYMAPERALGNPATVQTEIYSLGVILYQILTLRYPFHRKSLKEFRRQISKEVLHEPSVVAPYRDVPHVLARMAMKCLSKDPALRYGNVDELLYDLESYIEGRSEWFLSAELNIENKFDWEFQENILIAEHIAITRGPEISDWVSLMISKKPFDKNTKIEATVRLGEKGNGLGFLFSIPEISERVHLNDGYSLWIGSELNRTTKLSRSMVEALHAPDVYLQPNEDYRVRIEKIDNHIYFYLNDILQFTYLDLLPMIGTHIGLLSRDADFQISQLQVFTGGQNIMVNCLAVPDAFLAQKDYTTALSEYRRIAYSFPGRAEGREARFRAGITLLEQARNASTEDKEALYDQVFTEFELLHNTPGAPLEYLGKALTYEALNDIEEELKCFELALRRYPLHPLLTQLKEQILYRMHESSRYDRKSTYSFILLVVRYLPHLTTTISVSKLISSLEKHWELLPFIEVLSTTEPSFKNLSFAIQLAFWLAKPYALLEIIEDLLNTTPFSMTLVANAIFCLIVLDAWPFVEKAMNRLSAMENDFPPEEKLIIEESIALLQILIDAHKISLNKSIDFLIERSRSSLKRQEERAALFLLEKAIDQGSYPAAHRLANYLLEETQASSLYSKLLANCGHIWAYLLENDFDKAGKIFESYHKEILSKETPLHFLYGCWLYAAKGKEASLIHFSSLFENPSPRSSAIFSHYYSNKIDGYKEEFLKIFPWEKKQLYRQTALFFHCRGNEEKALHYRKLAGEVLNLN